MTKEIVGYCDGCICMQMPMANALIWRNIPDLRIKARVPV